MRIMPTDLGRENDPDYEYIPDPLGRLGRGTWRRRRRLDPFGRIEIDPKFESFREGFDLAKPFGALFRGRTPDLVAPVGREGENERFDVALIETLLAKTGFFDLAPTGGPTGYYGSDLDDAIRRFQKTANLKVDGLVNPGGPTLSALKTKFAATEDASEGGDEENKEDDKDSGGDEERKPVDLLEAAMRRKSTWEPRDWGEILDGGGFPAGGGGGGPGRVFGRKPAPPPPVMPGGDTGRSDPGRPPADTEVDSDPNSDQARREALADEFVKDITKPLESHRGDATTQKGNDIVARECRAVLREDYPDLADIIEHAGGATVEGKGEEKISEKYIPNKERAKQGLDGRPGSSNPDLSWKRGADADDEGRNRDWAHVNTVSTKADNETPTAWEQGSLNNLKKNVTKAIVGSMPKLGKDEDAEDYAEKVRAKCREIFEKWLGPHRRKGRDGEDDDSNPGLGAP